MLILVVDDEEDLRNLLEDELVSDHNILTCGDGATALKILEANQIDVVITDHVMPKIFGMELIVKGKKVSPKTMFLLMTGMGYKAQEEQSTKIGADGYINKPLDLVLLKAQLKEIAKARRAGKPGTLELAKPAVDVAKEARRKSGELLWHEAEVSKRGLRGALTFLEARLVEVALESSGGDVEKAARLLRVAVSEIEPKLKQVG